MKSERASAGAKEIMNCHTHRGSGLLFLPFLIIIRMILDIFF
jgi:hypothetical protein